MTTNMNPRPAQRVVSVYFGDHNLDVVVYDGEDWRHAPMDAATDDLNHFISRFEAEDVRFTEGAPFCDCTLNFGAGLDLTVTVLRKKWREHLAMQVVHHIRHWIGDLRDDQVVFRNL